MQPLASVWIRRPFHWGIVIISDVGSGGLIPDVNPESAVSANDNAIIARVRHAQDVESFDGDFEWAEADVLVRLVAQPESPSVDRRVLFRGRLAIPTGRISVGDADGDVVLAAHPGWNEVVVSVACEFNVTDLSPGALRIDLLPGHL